MNGSTWLVKPGIAQRIAELRESAAVASEKSKTDIARWLCDIIDGKKAATSVQLKASELLNRMNG